jgi:hypothetical protein
MLLRQASSGHMVEVKNIAELIDLNCDHVTGQYQEGEEEQDPVSFAKTELHFLSGEDLPRCWTDPHYRDDEKIR